MSWDEQSPRALGEVDPKRLNQAVVWRQQRQIRMEKRSRLLVLMTSAELVLLGIIVVKLFGWV